MWLSEERRRKIISAIGEDPEGWDTKQNREFFERIEIAARAYRRKKPIKKGLEPSKALRRIEGQVTMLRTLFDELDPLSQRIIRKSVGEQLQFDKGQRTKQGKRFLNNFFKCVEKAIAHARSERGDIGRPGIKHEFIQRLAKILFFSKQIRFSTVKTTKARDKRNSRQKSRFNNRPVMFCLAVFEAIGDPQTLDTLRPTMKRVVTELHARTGDDSEDDDDLGASESGE